MTAIDLQINAELDLRARLHKCFDHSFRAAQLLTDAQEMVAKGDMDAARALLPIIRRELEAAKP